MTKRKNNASFFLVFLGLLFISGAIFWARYNSGLQRRAGEATQAILTQLYRQVPKNVQKPTVAVQQETFDQPDYIVYPELPMPVCEIDGVLYIGILSIPDLKLELSIASECDDETLGFTACRYTGSAYQDDLVISAHNYGTLFGSIGTLQPGSPVYFTDMDGNVFSYSVALVEVLLPTDYVAMTQSDYPLTLFTCTYGGSYRITVRCIEQAEQNSLFPEE